jgi:predicted nucleic acid-binding protein
MRNIFIDANIIIDWLNEDSTENALCTKCIQTITGQYKKPMVSNTSIAIAFYFISKKYRNKSKVTANLKAAFSFFSISIEDEEVTRLAFDSKFKDSIIFSNKK